MKVEYLLGAEERVTKEQTWMLSWSNRQSSAVMVSGWFGACTIERDLPPNMREMGDSGDLTYSRSCLRQ